MKFRLSLFIFDGLGEQELSGFPVAQQLHLIQNHIIFFCLFYVFL